MTSNKLNWCIVRLGEDLNWWVSEVSEDIHWDVDGLGILDPNQIECMVDLLAQLQAYGIRNDIVENAFFKFSIEKDLPKNTVKLVASDEELMSAKDKIFAMPNVVDEGDGPYIDFLDHITSIRVKILNANLDFQRPLEVEELEEAVRDERQAKYVEGKSCHAFDEIISILDYVPAGYTLDDDSSSQELDNELDLPEFDDCVEGDDLGAKIGDNRHWDE
ncbi:MAG: hypothetical protein LBB15_02665 [Puniceicoccales bacterium]|jgi:hypothetical protein|nr:hypothetical protein [Puniceicoccales bacterium]